MVKSGDRIENLKEPRNRILRIILVWSLFCLMRIFVVLHFLQFSKYSFQNVLCCVFCFELNVLNQDIKICFDAM